MATRSRPAQYADLETVPPLMVGEIIGGELITSPRPSSKPTRVASRLGALLLGPFDLAQNGPGGWVILDEPEIHLYGDAAIPDLAGWRRERMPAIPDVAAFTLTPDWVCEVLSR